MGVHFEALDEGVLLVPLDPRYTQVGLNLVSVQVCNHITNDVAATMCSMVVKPISYRRSHSDVTTI